MAEVEQFERWVRQGLGRAVLWLEENDDAPVRDVLTHAATHETSYDAQVEGNHAGYIHELIGRTSEPGIYSEALLKALRASTDDERDDHFIVSLGAFFADDGDEEAREVLYGMAARGGENWEHVVAELAMTDGLSGLVRIAQSRPRDLRYSDPGYLIYLVAGREELDSRHIAIARAFAAALACSPELAGMLTMPDDDEEKESASSLLDGTESYDVIRPMLSGPPEDWDTSGFRLSRWGMEAPDSERERAAAELLSRSDDAQWEVLRGLQIFRRSKRPFPGPIDRIISWAAPTPDIEAWVVVDRIAQAAGCVLELCRRPEARACALDWIASGRRPGVAAGCLATNFEEGDWSRLEGLLEATEDRERHSVGMAIRDAAQEAGPEAVPALLALYECGECGFCRHGVVTRLDDLDAVPDWMVAECVHDAYSENREWAEARVTAAGPAGLPASSGRG